MNDHPWFSIEEKVPTSDEMVEIRYEVEFLGKYMPGCKIGEWVAEDGVPIKYKPVAWRCVKGEK